MFSLFVFSIKNAFRKKGVSILAIFGVAVGICLMVFILASSEGINKAFSESFTKAAARITVSTSSSPMGLPLTGGKTSLIPKSYVKRIEKIKNVKSVSPRVIGVIPSKSLKTLDPFSIIVGVDPKKEGKNSPIFSIIKGRSFSKENEVIVGKILAQSVKTKEKREIKPGDTIEITLPPEKPQQTPRKEKLIIVGEFETGNVLEDCYLFSSEETVRKISKIPKDKINSIIVEVNSIDNVKGG